MGSGSCRKCEIWTSGGKEEGTPQGDQVTGTTPEAGMRTMHSRVEREKLENVGTRSYLEKDHWINKSSLSCRGSQMVVLKGLTAA